MYRPRFTQQENDLWTYPAATEGFLFITWFVYTGRISGTDSCGNTWYHAIDGP